MAHPLDNPLWHSLTTLHRPLALGKGELLRYPAEVAPFAAIPHPREVPVQKGEHVFLLGPQPTGAENLGAILQMLCEGRVAEVEGPEIVPLSSPADRAKVLELTALVYPHYFRPRTMEMGRYFGIFEGERLAAMIGERMGMPGFREISAVCTHPDFLGRGLARRLLAFLANDILAQGSTPFLHVSPKNDRARKLYEQNGWRTRCEMPFWSLGG